MTSRDQWQALAKRLDDKGRCCGRKPLVYKLPPRLFCFRCDAAFDPGTGKQIPNWAYPLKGALQERETK